jgi:hypothetical protein
MSFADLRPYFKARLTTVDSDLRENDDLFPEEVPGNLVHKSYSLTYGDFALTGGVQNGAFVYVGPVTLNVYFNGYSDPLAAVDTVWTTAQTIIQECCKTSQRVTQTSIKNILARNVSISPIGPCNDNVIRLSIIFECNLIIAVS